MAYIQAQNLSFAYPGQPAVWDKLNFSLPKGSFNLLLGPAGAGKSTLLRHFMPRLKPFGRSSGELLLSGQSLEQLPESEQVKKIAFVMQNPEDQIVCDSVWHELAFALENLGTDSEAMRLRIAEVANFFGIQTWFNKRTDELSGGQKRLLNLASVLVLRPELLILDEPLAQLDPIAASDFVALLLRINRELGITILLSDHLLTRLLEPAEQILYLDEGRLEIFASGQAFAKHLFASAKTYAEALPAAALITNAINPEEISLNVRDAKKALNKAFSSHPLPIVDKAAAPVDQAVDKENPPPSDPLTSPPAVEIKDLCFRYGIREPLVLDHLCLKVPRAQISFVMGGNASGKSTLLNLIAGLLKPEFGSIRFPQAGAAAGGFRAAHRSRWAETAALALLPQNPRLLFTAQSLAEDFNLFYRSMTPEQLAKVKDLYFPSGDEFSPRAFLDLFGLGEKWHSHPADLSGGELQRAGLAAVLLSAPDILLLDEPSKALTAADKNSLGRLLQRLCAKGLSVLAVTHDLDFAARFGNYCLFLFNGENVAEATPHAFFSGQYFYTTDTCRIAADVLPGAICPEEVTALWEKKISPDCCS